MKFVWWVLAAALCSVVASLLGFLVTLFFKAQPPPPLHEAHAVVIARPGKGESEAANRASQEQLLRSPAVLRVALREVGVADLGMVKRQKDPAGWLKENVRVSWAGDEVMVIALVGDDSTDEMTVLLEAVAEAYVRGANGLEDTERLTRLDRLKKFLVGYEDRLHAKRDVLNALGQDREKNKTAVEVVEQEVHALKQTVRRLTAEVWEGEMGIEESHRVNRLGPVEVK
jgi:hypothetical protein